MNTPHRTARHAAARLHRTLMTLWLTAVLTALLAAAPRAAQAQRPDSARVVEHRTLFGIGHTNLLNTYISPLEYTGTSLGVLHRTERASRLGRHLRVAADYSLSVAEGDSPARNVTDYDGTLQASGILLRTFSPLPGLRLAAGGGLEGAAGFIYNTRPGNNPAEGRLSASIAAAATADYAFRIGRRLWNAHGEVRVPLAGVAFTPRFGQSYYEIFGLGQSDGTCVFTQPFNSPSLHALVVIDVPLFGATLTAGWRSDVRQSAYAGLRRHNWTNQFVVGYKRRLQILR